MGVFWGRPKRSCFSGDCFIEVVMKAYLTVASLSKKATSTESDKTYNIETFIIEPFKTSEFRRTTITPSFNKLHV